jgi:hypothetical protein
MGPPMSTHNTHFCDKCAPIKFFKGQESTFGSCLLRDKKAHFSRVTFYELFVTYFPTKELFSMFYLTSSVIINKKSMFPFYATVDTALLLLWIFLKSVIKLQASVKKRFTINNDKNALAVWVLNSAMIKNIILTCRTGIFFK